MVRARLSDSGYRYVHAQYTNVREGELLGMWCGEGLHKRTVCFGPGAVTDHKNHAHHGTHQYLATDLPMEIRLSTSTASTEITVTTTSFTFAETLVDTRHVDGYGHGHVYVDGTKVGRVYGETFVLPDLEPGVYEVRVMLNTNDHKVYTRDGQPVSHMITVAIPE